MSTGRRKPPAIYPGKTSTVAIGGTMLTLQTEIGGDPLTVTTIVVNRGRTVKVFRELVAELEKEYPGLPLTDHVTRAHQQVAARLKPPLRLSPGTLASAALASERLASATPVEPINEAEAADSAAKDSAAKDAAGEAASLLLIKAVDAFDKLDHSAALNLLEAALVMLPDDPRILRSIANLRALV